MTSTDTSLLSLVKTIYHWRKPLIIVSIAAIVLAAVISLFLPNYYKAFSKFIPSNPSQTMPNMIFTNGGGGNIPFGTSDDLDRLQNIAGSGELAGYLIAKFGLYKHYGIDSTGDRAAYYIGLKFSKNYSISKDEYGGLEVAVEDTDPKLAADIANAAVEQIAKIDRSLSIANLQAMATAFEKTMARAGNDRDSLSKAINKINRRYRYPSIALRRELLSQASPGMTAEAQLGMLQRANKLSADSLASIIENLYTAGAYDAIRGGITEQLGLYKNTYLHLKAALNADIQTIQVVERAVKPQVKSRPVRSVIVVGAGFASLLLSVLGILLFEQYSTIDWKAITEYSPKENG
jgi:uncharacterized protein involved in exopolysaccharide biosynthesis